MLLDWTLPRNQSGIGTRRSHPGNRTALSLDILISVDFSKARGEISCCRALIKYTFYFSFPSQKVYTVYAFIRH